MTSVMAACSVFDRCSWARNTMTSSKAWHQHQHMLARHDEVPTVQSIYNVVGYTHLEALSR
jgi:hypothetical protein